MTTATEAPALGPLPHAALASVPVTLAMPACAACCALPLLVGAGILTAGFAAAVNQILIAAAIAPAVLAVVLVACRQRRKAAAHATPGGPATAAEDAPADTKAGRVTALAALTVVAR
ncbi:hypothetical protein, partial [Frankia sp. AvcI1]|uniref:hypothetical protein n=1 Tax=Frankia sp. AvcI1 TaxID=573496 RepID=UPI001F2191D3